METRPATVPAARNPRRWWILGALSLSLLVIGLDITVLSVALPTLVRELKATTTELQWVMDAYTLVLAGLLLPMGALGDRIGRKRLLLAGLAIFLAGSVLCAYSWSAGSVIGFRAFMGLGGAIIMPMTLGVLPVIFDEDERPRAIGVWSVVSAVSIPLGPIVGGWLLDHYFWGSVFLFNVPFIAAALVAVALLVPESRDPQARRMDPAGAVLAAAGLALLVYGIIEQPIRGWDGVTAGTMAAGAILLAFFAAWELRTHHPMLDVRLFANARFAWAVIAFGFVGLVLTGGLFVFTQYLQDVLGHRPFDAGLRMVPIALGVLVGGLGGSFLVRRIGNKLGMALGFAILAGGLGMLSTLSLQTGYTFVSIGLVVMGAGMGLAMTPGLDAIMGALPEGEFGAGSAVGNTFRQVGASIGVAVFGSIYLNRYVAELELPQGLPAPLVTAVKQSVGAADLVAARLPAPLGAEVRRGAHTAFMAGMDEVVLLSAGIALVTAILILAFLPSRKPAPSPSPRVGRPSPTSG